ncbi:MAG: hypothetical protein ACJ79H_06465 [Myxococcales bacterium]
MGSISKARRRWRWASLIAMLAATAASAQQPPTGTQTEKPQAPETAPARPQATPLPAVAQIGPAREIKLAEYTWFRFGAQVQLWFKAAQDRIRQTDGSDGGYALDFYCRRCRFFSTGSIVKDVYFNVLFEAANVGRADPTTGARTTPVPSILDAYGQVKFADAFWLSGGQILLPLTRNGLQPTTTYVSVDTANVATTAALQANTNTLRDLGVQANGFFADNHVEYRLGVYQGTRQPGTGAQTAGHNGPRVVAMVSANLWDPETGYVNGGHYYGTRKVIGVMGNFDYQALRKSEPATVPFPATLGAGADKNAYVGLSGAAFINYPLAGPNPRGGDEIVGLLQFGYYDGGLRGILTAPTNLGSYPLILKQTNYLAEAGYYNHGGHFSVFGKFEMRKISEDYPLAFRQALPAAVSPTQTWLAAGVKYYVAPANFLNFTLQYERVNNNDAPGGEQRGTNNITFQMQTILY